MTHRVDNPDLEQQTEAAEGRDAFLQKRDPDWSEVPWYF
jgi:1,4-dihydroxy-2-naphthoyl-CoA synthase